MPMSPPRLSIRAADAADAMVLAELRYRFRSALGAPIESEAAFVARAMPWFADRLRGERWRAWLAVDGERRIVGHVFVQFIEKVPNPVQEAEAIAYITNVYVLPEVRNQGIGALLLAEALRACHSVQVDTVILWPSQRSISLYRRHGFTAPSTLLERPLSSDD